MNAEDLRVFWDKNFGLSPPIGYRLRQTYKPRWFRIHTLPDAKRYPDSENDFQEILRRHNSMIEDVLGDTSSYVLLSFEENLAPALDFESTELAFKVPFHELDSNSEEEGHISIWMYELEWRPNSLDSLLRLVALDKLSNLGIVNTAHASLCFPYDGGGDVILSKVEELMHLKNEYSDWLSKHPEGL